MLGQPPYPVILFDGVCNLCNSAVQFVIKHDSKGMFRFTALQSDFGQQLLEEHHVDAAKLDTIYLYWNGVLYDRSSAALRIARHLNGLWFLLYGFMIVPKPLRDLVYNWISARRYKIWGKQESCWVPTPELKSKFL